MPPASISTGIRAMQLQLKGKIIAITGGAKGIGAAIARACAEEGAVPVVIDRDAEAGGKIEQELSSAGGKWIEGDLSVAEGSRRAVETIIRNYSRIDALVNNAGVNDRVGLEQGS